MHSVVGHGGTWLREDRVNSGPSKHVPKRRGYLSWSRITLPGQVVELGLTELSQYRGNARFRVWAIVCSDKLPYFR